VPYLSASEVVFHEEALYQVYAPLDLLVASPPGGGACVSQRWHVIIIIIIIIIIQEKIYVAFSPSELQGHVTMSKS